MTYKDVYKKFMIEYDKADISSSYPSLTIYEVATLLDKAMLALIAQKATGNNPRQTTMDIDMKSMSDLQSIIINKQIDFDVSSGNANGISNLYMLNPYKLDNLLYPIHIVVNGNYTKIIKFIPSIYAYKFYKTCNNDPWIKSPVAYMSEDTICVLCSDDDSDLFNQQILNCQILYIKKPDKFTTNLMDETKQKQEQEFPLSDNMCEELINLAIIFACRNVSDPRISTEMQTKSLES